MNTENGDILKATMLMALPPEERAKYIEFKRPLTERELILARVDPYSPCACGSGKKFKFCCRTKTK